MVETSSTLQAEDAYGLKYAQGADPIGVGGVFGLLKAYRHVGLSRQIVNLVRLDLLNDAYQAGRICQVAVVQDEPAVVDVGVLVQMVDTIGIEERGPSLDAVDLVALF